jgi:SAM-dependent methyltransferase
MHPASLNEMRENLTRHCADFRGRKTTVLDIGSANLNGSYRELMPHGWTYIGTDLVAGNGVDVHMDGEFSIPLDPGSVDIVISGQCLEHCRNPFLLVSEAVRVLKPGGLILLVAPFVATEHKHPLDCFRFLPDGMCAIFDHCGIETIATYKIAGKELGDGGTVDCWGIGRKQPAHPREAHA